MISAATNTITSLVQSEYKYGFYSDIETESAPPELNEEIIRLISHKKNELEWRLKGEMFRRFGTEVAIPVRSGDPPWGYLTLSKRASRNREVVAGRWAAAKSF